MKKRIFFIVLLICCIFLIVGYRKSRNVVQSDAQLQTAIQTPTNPMIHRQGNILVDGTGKPVVLKAVNLAGWFLWEGWIWGDGFVQEKTMRERLASLVGNRAAQSFESQFYNTFITEKDFQRIKAVGFNSIRLPFNHTLLEDDAAPFAYKAEGWTYLDRVIGWAEKYNLYVVLDLHAAPGGQSNGFIADPDPINLWESETNKQRTVALWKAIANRYKDKQSIAGYDVLNEPNYLFPSVVADMYKRIIAGIRQVDTNHAIIVEGTNFAHDLSIFSSPPDANSIYSFHLYTWTGDKRATTQSELQTHKAIAQAQNMPLWNGEFGENSYDILEFQARLMEQPSSKVSGGWAFFPWKKVGNQYPSLMEIPLSPRWQKVIEWISTPLLKPKPTLQEAQDGMADFLAAIPLANNRIDRQTVETLFPVVPTTTIAPSATIRPPTLPFSPVPTFSLAPSHNPSVTPGNTQLSLTTLLHGIGKGGDNANSNSIGNMNPLHTERQVTIELFNQQNQPLQTTTGTIGYTASQGHFTGTIRLGTIQDGSYTLKIKTPYYLKKTVPGIVQIRSGQATVPSLALPAGDSNNDNRLSILDYNILLDCFSDIKPPINCASDSKKQSADITDDGNVNQFDYNLFLRELSVQSGE